jgi:hypothetical protein
VASFLLHPLATTRALLVVRIFLASVSTLTFTLALVTGIVSRYSVCHNPTWVLIIRIFLASVSTLTFTLTLVTGIVSRYRYSVCHNPAGVLIIRILIGLGVHSHPSPSPW